MVPIRGHFVESGHWNRIDVMYLAGYPIQYRGADFKEQLPTGTSIVFPGWLVLASCTQRVHDMAIQGNGGHM